MLTEEKAKELGYGSMEEALAALPRKPQPKPAPDRALDEDGEIVIPKRSFSQKLRRQEEKGEEKGRAALLKDLGVEDIDELKARLRVPKTQTAKDAPADPKNAAQAAAAEIAPPKKDETQEDWLKRVKGLLDETVKAAILPLQEKLEASEARWEAQEEAAREEVEAAEQEAAWEQFRKIAVKKFGVRKERLDAVEDAARRVLKNLSEEIVEQLDGTPDGIKLWDEVLFAQLREDAELAGLIFAKKEAATSTTTNGAAGTTEGEKKAPVVTDIARKPATTGTRGAELAPSAGQAGAAAGANAAREQRKNIMTMPEGEFRGKLKALFGRKVANGTPVAE